MTSFQVSAEDEKGMAADANGGMAGGEEGGEDGYGWMRDEWWANLRMMLQQGGNICSSGDVEAKGAAALEGMCEWVWLECVEGSAWSVGCR